MKNTDLETIRLQTGHVLKYYIGDMVYVKTDPDQHLRIITGIMLLPNKGVMYMLSYDDTSHSYYEEEITPYKNVII